MGLSFANPALLALLGLMAVPIVVHLLTQGDYRVVPVGSLRWLRAQEQPRWSRLQLHEPWRLLLRCMLIGAAVLALAGPSWLGRAASPATLVLVDPSADPPTTQRVVRELEEAARKNALTVESYWLASGFPSWRSSAAPPVDAPPIYSLLAAADDALPPGPIVVVADAQARRLGWRRPTVARDISWTLVPGASTSPAPAPAGRHVASCTMGAQGMRHG